MAAVLLLGGVVVADMTTSGAVHNDGLFELGPAPAAGSVTNIVGDGGAHAGPDWGDLFAAGTGGARSSLVDADSDGVPAFVDDDDADAAVGDTDDGFEGVVFVEDPLSSKGLSDPTIFAASNKNNDATSTWRWDSGNNPPKDDLANVYAYALRDANSDLNADGVDDLIIFVGIERLAPEGDSHLDVEFNQGGLGLDEAIPCNDPGNDPTPCKFVGEKEEDDVLIVMDFQQGGTLGFVEFREWNGTEYVLDVSLGGEGCNAADVFCAFNNGASINGGLWTNFDRHGNQVTDLETNAFTEIGFNVSAILGQDPCINTINAKSRTSASFNSELKDFALDEFDICNPSTDLSVSTTVTDENGAPVNIDAVVVGSTVTFTVTETNDGDVELATPGASRDSLVTSPDCTLEYDDDPDVASGGDADGDGVFDVGETWTFTCDVTLASTGTFTFDAVGHGVDHLGRDVTWRVTESTSDTDCVDVGDGATLNLDADPAAEVLCDEDEADSLELTVINPSTDLDLAVDSGDVTDIDPGAGTTLAAHRGDTIDFTIVEANDSNTGLTIPGATDDELDMIEVTVDFTPSGGSPTSDTCDGLTFDGDALIDASGDLVPYDAGNPDHADVNADGWADGNGDKVLDAGEAWLYSCSVTIDEGGTATVTAVGHGIDPLGRDVTWYLTDDTEDTDCASEDTSSLEGILCDLDEIDSVVIEILAPSTSLTKTATVDITYAIAETNDGNVALSEPTDGWVDDDECTSVSAVLGADDDGDVPPSDSTHNVGDHDNDGLLDPGETFQFTCTTTGFTVPSGSSSNSVTNTATGHGTDPLGADVTNDSTNCESDNTLITSTDPDVWCDGDEVDSVKVEITYYDGAPPST